MTVTGPEVKETSSEPSPVFGGYEDKTAGNGDVPADAPLLKVGATAIFGGVDVKNRRE